MVKEFIVTSESFVDRAFFINNSLPQEELPVDIIQEEIQPETEKQVEAAKPNELEFNIQTEVMTLSKETSNVESDNNEASLLTVHRTIEQLKLVGKPATSADAAFASAILETTFRSASEVVAARLAYSKQIENLISTVDTLTNALLNLAENFKVELPSDKINYSTGEITRVMVPVTKTGAFSDHELALITILLRKKMESMPATTKELTSRIERLDSDILFKNAQIHALKKRLEAIENIKPNVTNIFVIKRQGREKYLYVVDGKIKARKLINKDVIYTSLLEAEQALIYSIKNFTKTKVRKVITYEIVQLSYVATLSPSKALLEAKKNAYK